MAEGTFAWVTRAPADYMLVFAVDPEGRHAVVVARCDREEVGAQAARGLEGAELADRELRVYCTLPGEAERVRAQLEARAAPVARVERGSVTFVAAGAGDATTAEAAERRRNATAHVVVSVRGEAPRRYGPREQCRRCGEFRGQISVMPRGAMLIDTRELRCRCDSIPCRYCGEGSVRRPLNEHLDPEWRAGTMPWFGYLVPCGACQTAGRGPRVLMST